MTTEEQGVADQIYLGVLAWRGWSACAHVPAEQEPERARLWQAAVEQAIAEVAARRVSKAAALAEADACESIASRMADGWHVDGDEVRASAAREIAQAIRSRKED